MQDNSSLYLVMELVTGGDLFTYLRSMTRLDVNTTRFYSAQVVCIFEYLHKRNTIYRDLKPENILIDRSGYIKLTDFGFAKILKVDDRTYTLCGTPEYLAPEVVKNQGHGKPADWWTLGIFLYELLAGIDPFVDEDILKIYDNILYSKLKFPVFFDKSAKNLVKKLLERDCTKRIGNLIGGINDIKSHRFFADEINFKDVLNMTVKPPYLPRVGSISDMRNFPVYPNSNSCVNNLDPSEDPFIDW